MPNLDQQTMPDAWRSVLSCRSVKDKIAVAIECDLAPVDMLPAVTELVRDGYMVWIDRATLMHLVVQNTKTGEIRRGVPCDVYQLTEKGVALCDANGIKQQ